MVAFPRPSAFPHNELPEIALWQSCITICNTGLRLLFFTSNVDIHAVFLSNQKLSKTTSHPRTEVSGTLLEISCTYCVYAFCQTQYIFLKVDI